MASDVRKLVLPVDGSACSERAVKYVIALARQGVGLDVHLINVQPPIDSAYLRRFISQEMVETYHRQEGEAVLEPAAAMLTAAEVPFHRVIDVGHAGETIAAYAAEHKCDGIVMGTRGMGSAGNLVLGSVAARVIHHAHVPVTLIK